MSSAAHRLAFVTPTYFSSASVVGGGERYPLNLARGVVKASGGRATVQIVSFGPSRQRVDLADGVSMVVLPVAYAPGSHLNPVSWDLLDVLQEVDVVHAHQLFTHTGEAAVLFAALQNKPVFGTDLGAHASVLGRRYGMLELMDGLICISDFSAAMMETTAPVAVIRGGVDTEWFIPAAARADRGHILYVGRLLPHKGIDNLLLAVPADLPVVICGTAYDDEYHRHLVTMAEGKQVRFISAPDDEQLRDLYRSALATVLPSVYRDYRGAFQPAPELMGLTLVESMSCGTPAVCSRVGGMPELIRDGETGFIYDTVEELGRVIRDLRDGRADADAIGAEARRTAVAEYDLGVVGGRALGLYDEALARR